MKFNKIVSLSIFTLLLTFLCLPNNNTVSAFCGAGCTQVGNTVNGRDEDGNSTRTSTYQNDDGSTYTETRTYDTRNDAVTVTNSNGRTTVFDHSRDNSHSTELSNRQAIPNPPPGSDKYPYRHELNQQPPGSDYTKYPYRNEILQSSTAGGANAGQNHQKLQDKVWATTKTQLNKQEKERQSIPGLIASKMMGFYGSVLNRIKNWARKNENESQYVDFTGVRNTNTWDNTRTFADEGDGKTYEEYVKDLTDKLKKDGEKNDVIVDTREIPAPTIKVTYDILEITTDDEGNKVKNIIRTDVSTDEDVDLPVGQYEMTMTIACEGDCVSGLVYAGSNETTLSSAGLTNGIFTSKISNKGGAIGIAVVGESGSMTGAFSNITIDGKQAGPTAEELEARYSYTATELITKQIITNPYSF